MALQLDRYRVHEEYLCSYPLRGIVAVYGQLSIERSSCNERKLSMYFPGGAAGEDVSTGEGGGGGLDERVPKLESLEDGEVPKLESLEDGEVPKLESLEDGEVPKLESLEDGEVLKWVVSLEVQDVEEDKAFLGVSFLARFLVLYT